jgi:hypothetical protein
MFSLFACISNFKLTDHKTEPVQFCFIHIDFMVAFHDFRTYTNTLIYIYYSFIDVLIIAVHIFMALATMMQSHLVQPYKRHKAGR